jgi:hypothetical protein
MDPSRAALRAQASAGQQPHRAQPEQDRGARLGHRGEDELQLAAVQRAVDVPEIRFDTGAARGSSQLDHVGATRAPAGGTGVGRTRAVARLCGQRSAGRRSTVDRGAAAGTQQQVAAAEHQLSAGCLLTALPCADVRSGILSGFERPPPWRPERSGQCCVCSLNTATAFTR